MNEQNINALEEMLARWRPQGMSATEFQSWLPVAMYLSSQGVLAPPALTTENTWTVFEDIDGLRLTSDEARAMMVSRLGRIAKGEE